MPRHRHVGLAPGPSRSGQLSRFSRPSACWFQGTRCVVPAPRISREVREVPVVGGAQRLRVREPRLPAEQRPRLLDRDERVLVRGPVVPLGERRQVRELERAQRQLGRPDRHGPQPRAGAGVVDQRLQVVPHRAEAAGADVQRLAARPGRRSSARRRRRDPRRRAAGRGWRRRRGSGSACPRGSSRTGSRRRRAAPARRTSSAARSPRRGRGGRTRRTGARRRSSTRRTSRRRRADRPRGSDAARERRRRRSTRSGRRAARPPRARPRAPSRCPRR